MLKLELVRYLKSKMTRITRLSQLDSEVWQPVMGLPARDGRRFRVRVPADTVQEP